MKSQAYKLLEAGDAFSFLDMSGIPPQVKVGGRLSHWFDTGEPARLFEVTRLHHHPGNRSLSSVETQYVGFASQAGSLLTEQEIDELVEKVHAEL